MEIEPRFSIDKLTGTDLSFGPFKEWYFANNYIYDMGRNKSGRQSTWYMGLGTDIDTGLPMSGLAPIFPDTFYRFTHYWFAAADIPVANDIPVHCADAIRCNVRRPPQGSLPLLTRQVLA